MDILSLTKILQEFPLFRELPASSWPGLLEGHRFQNLKHHQTLFHTGEPAEQFAIVLNGAFKLVRPTPRGEDAIVYFATPGDVIGGLVMLRPNAIFPISAVSLGISTVLLLPRSTYLSSWATNAGVQQKINSALYSRMSVLQESKAISMLSLQQRVAALLLSLLDKQTGPQSTSLSIPLTRQEIADSVGSSVESVIRCMSEMSQQGLIATQKKTIEILRPDRIAELLKDR